VTPLPAPLGRGPLTLWRLDHERHKDRWNSGEGARLFGGRWNSVGQKAVYCSVDPATVILELAVHKGFRALDTVPHVLTAATVHVDAIVRVLKPSVVPNPNWLRPGVVSAGQQEFGDALLRAHPFVLVPSVVSTNSWNVIFDPDAADHQYALHSQERFALDTRLANAAQAKSRLG
jgi:RES domain-containing protein